MNPGFGRKQCTKCHHWKTFDRFYMDSHHKNIYRALCKDCHKKRTRAKHYETRVPVKRVNFAERIERIVRMDREANEYLSANNRPALKVLAAQMDEFGLHQRAQQLRLEAK
jgi:hypothetical protein